MRKHPLTPLYEEFLDFFYKHRIVFKNICAQHFPHYKINIMLNFYYALELLWTNVIWSFFYRLMGCILEISTNIKYQLKISWEIFEILFIGLYYNFVGGCCLVHVGTMCKTKFCIISYINYIIKITDFSNWFLQ